MTKLLSINNLHKVYYSKNNALEAIKDISFDINENEFITVVGPSGCGKSTLLNILTDMENLTSGTITYHIPNLKFGYMLQSDAMLDWLNVFKNATIGLDIKKIKTAENIAYTKNLLESYGLKDFLNKYPKELSGGMRQRLALIRTLALKPDILVLDEPFSKLDYQSRLKISDDIYKIIKKEKKTVLMVTHNIEEAICLSDKVIVLTKRPCTIKNIYEIKREKNTSPIKNHQDSNYSYYYNLIWKDLTDND